MRFNSTNIRVVLTLTELTARPLFTQLEKKKQENKMRRDQLNDEYLELLDKQRLYFKTVKDFKEVSQLQIFHANPADMFD